MGYRFRRSINLAGGTKFNIGKKSVGLSFGTKHARVSLNSSGRRTTSVNIPGTGVSYVSTRQTGGQRYTTYTPPTAGGTPPGVPTGIPPELPPQPPTPPQKKWYWSTGFIIISLFFCFPIGLYLMWRRSGWHIVAKCIVTVFFILMGFAATSDSSQDGTPTSTTSSAASSPMSSKASSSMTKKEPAKVSSQTEIESGAFSELQSSSEALPIEVISSAPSSVAPTVVSSSPPPVAPSIVSSTPENPVTPPIVATPESQPQPTLPTTDNSTKNSVSSNAGTADVPASVAPVEALTGNTQAAYWVVKGGSYHLSSSCSTLARSKNVESGTLQQALDGGHTDPCDICAGG